MAETVRATFEQEGLPIPQGFFGSAAYRTLLAKLQTKIRVSVQVGLTYIQNIQKLMLGRK